MIDDALKPVRLVPETPERSDRNSGDERSDLKFDRLGVRVNFVVGRAA